MGETDLLLLLTFLFLPLFILIQKSAWDHEKTALFAGSVAGRVHYFLPGQDRPTPAYVATHKLAVSSLFFDAPAQLLITGSWDKSIKFWDPRRPAAAAEDLRPTDSIDLPERVFAIDKQVDGPLLGVAASNRMVCIFDVRRIARPLLNIYSPLKFQSRCLKMSLPPYQKATRRMFLGAIDGRCAVFPFDSPDDLQQIQQRQKNPASFTFARGAAINAIAPIKDGKFVLGTSADSLVIADHAASTQNALPTAGPVTALAVHHRRPEQMLAFATGPDWSKRFSDVTPYRPEPPRIMIMRFPTRGDS